ncbi:MAG: hypothetical protein A2075_13945 [Geobacteraceae bacterium GWC2_58_44]|nr:MAG: hypothetical protein A2075_13945 [Geobacteraceae bacterium GWC2_58_44]HBG08026.1 DUF4071 domain-containing protein [Geobacter sp.]
MTQSEPLCLVLMPFDRKKDANGRVVDFEAVYHRLIAPAVQGAGLQPVRADEERTGGMIDQAMFERLVLCDYAVVDLTTASAAVFYQMGVRHAVKPHTTVLLYASGTAQLPFDVHQLEAVSYRVSPQGLPVYEGKCRTVLTERLNAARAAPMVDSPPFQLLHDFPAPESGRLEAIRERLQFEAGVKKRLARARVTGVAAVRELEASLGNISEADSGVVVELFFAYRAVDAWSEMIDLVPRMPAVVSATVLIQEQLAMALNRQGRGEEAEQLLRDLISRRGPSSESYGMLGRVLKNRWKKALEQGETARAKELLVKAAAAYLRGFESDWRDTYPGVNAVTLMELKEPADPRRRDILPVVHYAVEQRIRSGAADYWDYATLLELAALSCDEAKGVDALARSLARVRESWEAETTAGDLRLVREARQRRGADCPGWADEAEAEMLKAAARGTARP